MTGAPELLCGVCPHFEPCHLGEEIPDDDCWNYRRDHGLELVRPEPAPVPDTPRPTRAGVRTYRPKLSPDEYRARKAAGGRKAGAARSENWFRKHCGDGPRPPFQIVALLDRPDLWEYGEALKARMTRSTARHYLAACLALPREVLDDLGLDAPAIADARPDLDRKLVVSAVDRYRQIVLGATTPERRTAAHLRTPAVCAKRRARQAADWEALHFPDGRLPPVRLAVLAERPDLWTLAERLLAAGKRVKGVTSTVSTLSRIPAEVLADSTVSPFEVARQYSPTEASRPAYRGKIHTARIVLGIVDPDGPVSRVYSPAEVRLLKGCATVGEAEAAYAEAFPNRGRSGDAVRNAWSRVRRGAEA